MSYYKKVPFDQKEKMTFWIPRAMRLRILALKREQSQFVEDACREYFWKLDSERDIQLPIAKKTKKINILDILSVEE